MFLLLVYFLGSNIYLGVTRQMALARFSRQVKRPYGFCAKLTVAVVLGLCFAVLWSVFSSSSSSLTVRRESFDDIAEPVSGNAKVSNFGTQSNKKAVEKHVPSKKVEPKSDLEQNHEKKVNGSVSLPENTHRSEKKNKKEIRNKKKKQKIKIKSSEENNGAEESEDEESKKEKEEEDEEGLVVDGKEEALDREGEVSEDGEREGELVDSVDQESDEKLEDEDSELKKVEVKRKNIKGPLFDPKAHYNWKLCNAKSKHNYIPCIDFEGSSAKLQSYRHTERSCPKIPPMCLVPLPHEGYGTPVRWPDRKMRVY